MRLANQRNRYYPEPSSASSIARNARIWNPKVKKSGGWEVRNNKKPRSVSAPGSLRRRNLVSEEEAADHRNGLIEREDGELAVVALGDGHRTAISGGHLGVFHLQRNDAFGGIVRDSEFQIAQNSRL